jgi:hypothetical protein
VCGTVAYAVVLQAIDDPGRPVDLAEIPSTVCHQLEMPAFDPLTAATSLAEFGAEFSSALVLDAVPRAPAIASYATAPAPSVAPTRW